MSINEELMALIDRIASQFQDVYSKLANFSLSVKSYPALDVIDGTETLYVAGAATNQNFQISPQTLLSGVNNSQLRAWALSEAFRIVSSETNAEGVVVDAVIEWPDGVSGVYVVDELDARFSRAVNAWHATYAGSNAKTIVQPPLVRNANGSILAPQPAIIIS